MALNRDASADAAAAVTHTAATVFVLCACVHRGCLIDWLCTAAGGAHTMVRDADAGAVHNMHAVSTCISLRGTRMQPARVSCIHSKNTQQSNRRQPSACETGVYATTQAHRTVSAATARCSSCGSEGLGPLCRTAPCLCAQPDTYLLQQQHH